MTAPASVDRAERKCGECRFLKRTPLADFPYCEAGIKDRDDFDVACAAFSDGSFVKKVKALAEALDVILYHRKTISLAEHTRRLDKGALALMAVLDSPEMKEREP